MDAGVRAAWAEADWPDVGPVNCISNVSITVSAGQEVGVALTVGMSGEMKHGYAERGGSDLNSDAFPIRLHLQ